MFYHGVDRRRSGVGIILKEEYANSEIEESVRIVSLKT